MSVVVPTEKLIAECSSGLTGPSVPALHRCSPRPEQSDVPSLTGTQGTTLVLVQRCHNDSDAVDCED